MSIYIIELECTHAWRVHRYRRWNSSLSFSHSAPSINSLIAVSVTNSHLFTVRFHCKF